MTSSSTAPQRQSLHSTQRRRTMSSLPEATRNFAPRGTQVVRPRRRATRARASVNQNGLYSRRRDRLFSEQHPTPTTLAGRWNTAGFFKGRIKSRWFSRNSRGQCRKSLICKKEYFIEEWIHNDTFVFKDFCANYTIDKQYKVLLKSYDVNKQNTNEIFGNVEVFYHNIL